MIIEIHMHSLDKKTIRKFKYRITNLCRDDAANVLCAEMIKLNDAGKPCNKDVFVDWRGRAKTLEDMADLFVQAVCGGWSAKRTEWELE